MRAMNLGFPPPSKRILVVFEDSEWASKNPAPISMYGVPSMATTIGDVCSGIASSYGLQFGNGEGMLLVCGVAYLPPNSPSSILRDSEVVRVMRASGSSTAVKGLLKEQEAFLKSSVGSAAPSTPGLGMGMGMGMSFQQPTCVGTTTGFPQFQGFPSAGGLSTAMAAPAMPPTMPFTGMFNNAALTQTVASVDSTGGSHAPSGEHEEDPNSKAAKRRQRRKKLSDARRNAHTAAGGSLERPTSTSSGVEAPRKTIKAIASPSLLATATASPAPKASKAVVPKNSIIGSLTGMEETENVMETVASWEGLNSYLNGTMGPRKGEKAAYPREVNSVDSGSSESLRRRKVKLMGAVAPRGESVEEMGGEGKKAEIHHSSASLQDGALFPALQAPPLPKGSVFMTRTVYKVPRKALSRMKLVTSLRGTPGSEKGHERPTEDECCRKGGLRVMGSAKYVRSSFHKLDSGKVGVDAGATAVPASHANSWSGLGGGRTKKSLDGSEFHQAKSFRDISKTREPQKPSLSEASSSEYEASSEYESSSSEYESEYESDSEEETMDGGQTSSTPIPSVPKPLPATPVPGADAAIQKQYVARMDADALDLL